MVDEMKGAPSLDDIDLSEGITEGEVAQSRAAKGNRDERGRYAKAESEEGLEEAPETENAEPEAPEADAEADDDEVEIPGEEGAEPKRLKLAEVIEGYRRAAELESKLSEATQMQPAVERQIAETVAARQEYLNYIQYLAQFLQPQWPELNLAQTDPDQYVALMQQAQQVQGMHQRLAAEAQRMQLAQDEQAEVIRYARLARETTKTRTIWPELASPEVQQRVTKEIEAYGFTPDEFAAVEDSRHLAVLKDALAYRKLMARQKEAAKTVAAKPKLVRSGARQLSGPTQAARASIERLRKTGSPKDAVDALVRLF